MKAGTPVCIEMNFDNTPVRDDLVAFGDILSEYLEVREIVANDWERIMVADYKRLVQLHGFLNGVRFSRALLDDYAVEDVDEKVESE